MKKNQELISDLLPLVAGGGGAYLVYKYIIEPVIKRTPVIPGRTPIDIPLEDSLVLEEPAPSGWGIDNVMPIVKILRESGIPANMETRPLRLPSVGQIATQYRLIVERKDDNIVQDIINKTERYEIKPPDWIVKLIF